MHRKAIPFLNFLHTSSKEAMMVCFNGVSLRTFYYDGSRDYKSVRYDERRIVIRSNVTLLHRKTDGDVTTQNN